MRRHTCATFAIIVMLLHVSPLGAAFPGNAGKAAAPETGSPITYWVDIPPVCGPIVGIRWVDALLAGVLAGVSAGEDCAPPEEGSADLAPRRRAPDVEHLQR